MGCFAKGCLISIIVFVVLFLGLVAVGFFSVRYVLSTAPVAIPVVPATPEEVQTLRQQFTDFKQTVTRNESLPPEQRQPAHLEYTAGQINQLISGSKGRGHVSVAISNGVMQVTFSLSTDALRKGHVELPSFADRYANGTFSVSTNGPTAPSQIIIQDPRLNGHTVPSSLFDTSYRGDSLRSYVGKYSSENEINTFQIAGDKVVMDTPVTP